jgi:hypothetical protein
MNLLGNITQKLLCIPLNYEVVRSAAKELLQFYYAQTNFEETHINNEHIETEKGLAVSPYSAAFCVVDFLRTRNFILAIKMAVEDGLQKDPEKPVIICYAGTGPFASLVVPLTTIFNSNQIQFLLIEVNEISISYLKKLITNIAIDAYIKDVIKADATEYDLPCPIDILLSETMKPGLDKEPQVSIVANLVKQCIVLPILIPENIEVSLAYSKMDHERGLINEKITSLLNFNDNVARKLPLGNEMIFSKGIDIELAEPPQGFGKLVLQTDIQLYKNIELKFNESSLTINHTIMKTNELVYPSTFNVKYVIDKKPGFVFEPLNKTIIKYDS